jgi:hypothetical protein
MEDLEFALCSNNFPLPALFGLQYWVYFVIKSGSDNVFLLVCVTSLKSHGDCAELGKLITLFIHVLGWIRPISTLWEIGERGAGV